MNTDSPNPVPPNSADRLFTLTAPRALEDELCDLLVAHPELVPGFTLLPHQGVGQRMALASAMEQVQGRAQRVLVQIAMRQADVEPLLTQLRQPFGGAQITWWVVPLQQFGRFA